MDQQSAFNTALIALRKQGVASMDEFGGCLYRGPNDCKCAVGHLIPDDVDLTGDNGSSARQLVAEGVYEPLELLGLDFLSDLQRVHDLLMPQPEGSRGDSPLSTARRKDTFGVDERSMGNWEAGMAELAESYDLVYIAP